MSEGSAWPAAAAAELLRSLLNPAPVRLLTCEPERPAFLDAAEGDLIEVIQPDGEHETYRARTGQLDNALGKPADADRGGTQMNLYVWPGKDGRSVDVALAASGERAREMVGDSPGRGPAGEPFVFRLSGIVEYEQHYNEHRGG